MKPVLVWSKKTNRTENKAVHTLKCGEIVLVEIMEYKTRKGVPRFTVEHRLCGKLFVFFALLDNKDGLTSALTGATSLPKAMLPSIKKILEQKFTDAFRKFQFE